jgi:alkylhydroperoxidase family enzyme
LSEELLDEGIDNYANSERFTAADKIALRYSELMSTKPEAVDDAFFDELRRYYSEDEFVELGVFIGLSNYHYSSR